MDVKPFFDAARELAGGRLTQAQVDELNKVVNRLVPDDVDISDLGVDLIRQFEGLRTRAYQDSVGIWTIGYGTIRYPNGVAVKAGDVCTEEQAKSYMKHDLQKFVKAVNKLVTVPLKQTQFDALVSLVYNIGEGAFAGSTLLKKLNSKDYAGTAAQFLVWNKGRVKGKLEVIPGLTNRRKKEKAYFEQ
ncbi:endolysin [Acinetobacter phage Minot]|nr:endolysin [Acinetobacter phage Minot]QQO96461.1 endolysin [Acinetobacter phage Mokit]QQO96711.1 endolysin - lysozyme murein hydrolase [Acinetobacter phage Melin]